MSIFDFLESTAVGNVAQGLGGLAAAAAAWIAWRTVKESRRQQRDLLQSDITRTAYRAIVEFFHLLRYARSSQQNDDRERSFYREYASRFANSSAQPTIGDILAHHESVMERLREIRWRDLRQHLDRIEGIITELSLFDDDHSFNEALEKMRALLQKWWSATVYVKTAEMQLKDKDAERSKGEINRILDEQQKAERIAYSGANNDPFEDEIKELESEVRELFRHRIDRLHRHEALVETIET